MVAKLSAELMGTFWLVLGGCGAAVLAADFPDVGIGLLGASLAFGLTVLTAAYAFRSYFGRTLKSRGLSRTVGRRTLSGGTRVALHCGASRGRDAGCRSALPNRDG